MFNDFLANVRYCLRGFAANKGWMVTKLAGLPVGTDLIWDLQNRLNISVQFVIDVGAHKGETIHYLRRHINPTIYAFEPVSATFELLKRNWGHDDTIRLYQLALSDRVGTALIELQPDSQTNSILKTGHSIFQSAHNPACTEVIRLSRLDSVICMTTSPPKIDLLKIDVEGHELSVLKGATGLLRDNRIRSILCEYTLDQSDNNHTYLASLVSYLQTWGFSLVCFYDQCISDNPSRHAYGNALFVHSSQTAL